MTFHWLITVQYAAGPGIALVTRTGTVTAQPGATRGSLYGQVRDFLTAQTPETESGNVLFWSLEPDQL